MQVALESGVGINVVPITVPAGTVHLRAATFDETTDGATDDLDLYRSRRASTPTGTSPI